MVDNPSPYQPSWKDLAIGGNLVIAIVLNRYSGVFPFGVIVALVFLAVFVTAAWLWKVSKKGGVLPQIRSFPISCIVVFLAFAGLLFSGISSMEKKLHPTGETKPIVEAAKSGTSQSPDHALDGPSTATPSVMPPVLTRSPFPKLFPSAAPSHQRKTREDPIRPEASPVFRRDYVPTTEENAAFVDIESQFHILFPTEKDQNIEKEWINAELRRRGYPNIRVWGLTPREQPLRNLTLHNVGALSQGGGVGIIIQGYEHVTADHITTIHSGPGSGVPYGSSGMFVDHVIDGKFSEITNIGYDNGFVVQDSTRPIVAGVLNIRDLAKAASSEEEIQALISSADQRHASNWSQLTAMERADNEAKAAEKKLEIAKNKGNVEKVASLLMELLNMP